MEDVLPGLRIHQREVYVAAAASQIVVPFCHKRNRMTLRMCDFLHGVFHDDVSIRHLQGICIPDVEFLLARPPFTLGILDRNAGSFQTVPHGAQHRFLFGCLENMVVFDIGSCRLRTAKIPFGDVSIRLVEQIELQLGRRHRRESAFLKPRDLAAQDGPGTVIQIITVMVHHVAEYERGTLQPRRMAHRGQVWLHHEIAISFLPTGRSIPRDRLHIDVIGEEIVTRVGLFVRHIDKEPGLKSFTDEPSEHVRKTDQHGVNSARLDSGLQLVFC